MLTRPSRLLRISPSEMESQSGSKRAAVDERGSPGQLRLPMRPRAVLRKLHLWLALPLGGLFVLTAGSGALLVFGPEIDRALHPRLFRATPGPDVGLDRVAAAVARAFAGRAITRIDLPALRRAGGVYVVQLAGEPRLDVHVDPGTGSVLGTRHEGASPVEWIRTLHTELAAGPAGSTLVGLGGLGLLVVIATGAVLWWTGRRTI